MKVSYHARAQLLGRMLPGDAVTIIHSLERAADPGQSEAWVVRRRQWLEGDGQSNGDTLIAIIEDGVVVTCYWRRSTQAITAEQFGVEALRDMTRTEKERA